MMRAPKGPLGATLGIQGTRRCSWLPVPHSGSQGPRTSPWRPCRGRTRPGEPQTRIGIGDLGPRVHYDSSVMHRAQSPLLHVSLAGVTACFLAVPVQASSAAGPLASPAAVSPAISALEPSSAQEGKSRRTLEDILKEVRNESGRAATALYPDVVRIVAQIDDLKASRTGPRSNEKRQKLAELGPMALPLLVPYLEPGKKFNRKTVFRSQLIADLLRDTPAATTTDALLELASTGSAQGRLNALLALESTPEPKRVAPVVVSIAKSDRSDGLSPDAEQTVINAAFCTLALLDDQDARRFIAESVRSSDQTLCAGALVALAGAPAETSAPQILEFLSNFKDAKPVASAIADYYEQHDALLDDPEHARALGSIAIHETTPSEPRIRMFDTLRVTDAKIGSPIKRGVEPFRDASRPDMRVAAQMLLARLKDRGAKNELFNDLNSQIKQNKKSITAHQNRAELYHAIGDWSAAERDWRVVMKQIAADDLARSRKEPYVGLARALARLRKFKEAASYLSQGPISVDELQALGNDRDFRAMRESRYKEVFQ